MGTKQANKKLVCDHFHYIIAKLIVLFWAVSIDFVDVDTHIGARFWRFGHRHFVTLCPMSKYRYLYT